MWNREHPSPGLDLKHGAWVWPFTLTGTLPFLLLYKSLVPGHLLLHPEPCRPIYHSSVPFLPHRDSYIFWCGYGFSLFHILSSHIFGAGESLKAWTYDTTVTRSLPDPLHIPVAHLLLDIMLTYMADSTTCSKSWVVAASGFEPQSTGLQGLLSRTLRNTAPSPVSCTRSGTI